MTKESYPSTALFEKSAPDGDAKTAIPLGMTGLPLTSFGYVFTALLPKVGIPSHIMPDGEEYISDT